MSGCHDGGDPVSACFVRDAAAVITRVDDAMSEVLGWRADQLVGRPSTGFIHPEDQPSAIAAWFSMLSAPGDTRVWRGRYQSADGTWKWVETLNRNQLDDPIDPAVYSTMTPITVDQVSAEEELRARKQLLSRLSDALPVGLFQIDGDRHVTFTNDRFHAIVGCPPAATADAQFVSVITEDKIRLDAVLSAVLSDEPVDDIEIRLQPAPASPDLLPGERVCVLAMRPLTDSDGTVTGAIGCLSDVTDRAQLRRELELRAATDSLTSCMNRARTLELLADVLSDQATSGAPTAIMYIDLDEFKAVNDRFGHAAGDRLLEIAARRLRGAVRDDDEIGRIGGDEFLVICPDVDTTFTALAIGERLTGALTATIRIEPHTVELRASVGIAWTDEPIGADAFIARADHAMYQAKRAQRLSVGARPSLYAIGEGDRSDELAPASHDRTGKALPDTRRVV
jgi:diguanylate cyclase (GGDEF)-like protein/PAS domain S-box-containing protein